MYLYLLILGVTVVRLIKTGLILTALLFVICPALAGQEKVVLGPYNVSFDMNTTMDYNISIENPSMGMTSDGARFTRYNVTVDSKGYFTWLILTAYNASMLADIQSNMDIVTSTLDSAGCDEPKVYNTEIDGKPGVIGVYRFKSGDLLVCASYSPDAVAESSQSFGRMNCRVLSSYPWEVTRDMLNALRVAVPNGSDKSAN
jgi:hypothetical protein